MNKVNIAEKLSTIDAYWSPRIAGELNGQYVKLVRFIGEFVWHHHDNEDEMFLVVKGSMRMDLEEGPVTVNEGEFIIIPKGVEHRPVADQECHVMLFEPNTTLNTGNVRDERTLERLQWV